MDDASFNITQDTKEDQYFPWIGGQPDSTPGSSSSKTSTASVSDLVGRVRCVSDQRGNALLVSANVHYFPQILQLISEVDAPSDKVMIEARIVQVSSDYLDKLGVRWSPNGSAVFSGEDYDDSLLASGSGSYQAGLGNNTTVNPPASTSALSAFANRISSSQTICLRAAILACEAAISRRSTSRHNSRCKV